MPVKHHGGPLPAPGGPERRPRGPGVCCCGPWCVGGAGPTCSLPLAGHSFFLHCTFPTHLCCAGGWDTWKRASIKQGCAHRPLAAQEEVAGTPLAPWGPRLRPARQREAGARGCHLATEGLPWCSARPPVSPSWALALWGPGPAHLPARRHRQAVAGTLGWLHAQVSPTTTRGQSCWLPAHRSASAASRPAG